jgi:peptide/nickel transport system permease protein
VFFISINTPGDPVEMILEERSHDLNNSTSRENMDLKVKKIRALFNLNLPTFYFKITDQTQSDTLYKIEDQRLQTHLSKIAFECGSWELVNDYYSSVKKLRTAAYFVDDRSKNQSLHLLEVLQLKTTSEDLLNELATFKLNSQNNELSDAFYQLERNIIALNKLHNTTARYLPKFIWFGAENQYHYWISDFFSGDFGTSYRDRKPVSNKIGAALKWTLLISLLSIALSYCIGIPLGIYSARNHNSLLERFISSGLFSIHAIPSFWLASLLIIFLASYEYFPIFPSYGLGLSTNDSATWSQFLTVAHHLVLPVICWSYSSIAYISEQTKRSVLNELSADYIRTARAKGLGEKQIYWKHAFKNAAFPLITQIGNLFPALISGSFVIEYIFAIPGIGKLLLDSIALRDFPVVFGILMISAALILIGTLISDLLYAKLDKRITYSNQVAV